MGHIFFIHSSVDEHLGGFKFGILRTVLLRTFFDKPNGEQICTFLLSRYLGVVIEYVYVEL